MDRELREIIEAQPQPYRNGRWKVDPRWAVPLAVSIIGWIVTIMLAYGGFNARVSVLESWRETMKEQQHDRDLRLQRLEDKVDILLRRP